MIMKTRLFIYSALFALSLSSCNDNDMPVLPEVPESSSSLTVDAIDGELLIKFSPEMTTILDNYFVTRAAGAAVPRGEEGPGEAAQGRPLYAGV